MLDLFISNVGVITNTTQCHEYFWKGTILPLSFFKVPENPTASFLWDLAPAVCSDLLLPYWTDEAQRARVSSLHICKMNISQLRNTSLGQATALWALSSPGSRYYYYSTDRHDKAQKLIHLFEVIQLMSSRAWIQARQLGSRVCGLSSFISSLAFSLSTPFPLFFLLSPPRSPSTLPFLSLPLCLLSFLSLSFSFIETSGWATYS